MPSLDKAVFRQQSVSQGVDKLAVTGEKGMYPWEG